MYSLIPSNIGTRFPGEQGIKRMRCLVDALGNPERQFPVVHVAGTSGKGSTCYILARILQEAGYTVGLHVSPHVVDARERMQIGGAAMSTQEFASLVTRVRPLIERVSKGKYGQVTYFEALVALSFVYFARKKVDVAIIETGLGGSLDATNVVDSILSVITPIGRDHTRILGESLVSIAQNKAGIIKRSNSAVIVSAQKKQAMDVIEERAKKLSVNLLCERKEFEVKVKALRQGSTKFDYSNTQAGVNFSGLSTNLLGEYQAHNAGLAITVALELGKVGLEVGEENVREALREVVVPGRLETFRVKESAFPQRQGSRQAPSTRFSRRSEITVILDGAHNEDKMNALVSALKTIWPGQKFACIFAVKQNKDVIAMAASLAPVISRVYVTEFFATTDVGRRVAMKKKEVAEIFAKHFSKDSVKVCDTSRVALDTALQYSHGPILVTGSLYLVSELRSSII